MVFTLGPVGIGLLTREIKLAMTVVVESWITLIKILTDINRCLADPANRCLTDINQYYVSYSTYPVLVVLNQ